MYQSPLRPAGITETLPDKKGLQLARKKLLAELELSGKASIELDGYTLSRQHINALFDELADEQQLALHLAIYQHKPLLDFLETGAISPAGLGDVEAIQALAPARFSIIAADAAQKLIQQILKGEAPVAHYQAISSLAGILPPFDQDRIYQPAYRAFSGRASSLQAMIDDEKMRRPVGGADTQEWFNADRLELLNALPDSFGDLRYTIASNLNNLAVALDKNGKHRAALGIIKKADKINIPSSLKALIVDNRKIFRRNAWGYLGRLGWFQRLYSIIILLFVLFGFFSKIYELILPAEKAPDAVAGSKNTYVMDEDQRYNSQVYSALKIALAGWSSADTPKIPPVFLPVTGPCDTCGDPFRNVWSALFKTPDTMPEDSAGAARIVVINKLSGMDAIVLINIDNRRFSSIYLKPGGATTFFYRGINEAGFSFYIGSNWNPEARHEILLPDKQDTTDKTYQIKGAFTKVPHWQEYLSGQSDLFARTDIGGKPFIDTVQIVPGKDGRIEFSLGLDERDL